MRVLLVVKVTKGITLDKKYYTTCFSGHGKNMKLFGGFERKFSHFEVCLAFHAEMGITLGQNSKMIEIFKDDLCVYFLFIVQISSHSEYMRRRYTILIFTFLKSYFWTLWYYGNHSC